MPRHIKAGDQVMVIAGADKGQTGKVLRVLTGKQRVVVEGVQRIREGMLVNTTNFTAQFASKSGTGD